MGLGESFKRLVPVVTLLVGIGATPAANAQGNNADPEQWNANGAAPASEFSAESFDDAPAVSPNNKLLRPNDAVQDSEKPYPIEKLMEEVDCAVKFQKNGSDISDSQLLKILKCEQIQKVQFTDDSSLSISLNNGDKIDVRVLSSFAKDLHNYLLRKGIDTSLSSGNVVLNYLQPFLPLILGMVVALIVAGPHYLKKKKKLSPISIHEIPDVTFDDIGGLGNVKDELKNLVTQLEKREEILEIGGNLPKGILFTGPTGSGKTLAAKAVATEADIPFIAISGSELITKWSGDTSEMIRKIFENAREVAEENGACIIFIDELDSIGAKRSNDETAVGKGQNSDVNQLLVSMDGFHEADGILVIGATNYPDMLDPALTRPGRFDRELLFEYPDQVGRLEILKICTRDIDLDDDVRLEMLSFVLSEKSGADIANIIDEAILLVINEGISPVKLSQRHLTAAFDRAIFGLESDHEPSPADIRIAAAHEAGHVVMGLANPGVNVERVSIRPRGKFFGITQVTPVEERKALLKEELEWQIKMLLAGGIAELIELKNRSTGVVDDHRKATQIATQMITTAGMHTSGEDESLSQYRVYEENEEYPSTVDILINRLLETCGDEATCILKKNLALFHAIKNILLKKKTLEHDEIMAILKRIGIKK